MDRPRIPLLNANKWTLNIIDKVIDRNDRRKTRVYTAERHIASLNSVLATHLRYICVIDAMCLCEPFGNGDSCEITFRDVQIGPSPSSIKSITEVDLIYLEVSPTVRCAKTGLSRIVILEVREYFATLPAFRRSCSLEAHIPSDFSSGPESGIAVMAMSSFHKRDCAKRAVHS